MSISLKELEEGRRIAALVVRHCGDKYFPLFDRLDSEVQKRRSATDRIEAALGRPPLKLNAKAPHLDFYGKK